MTKISPDTPETQTMISMPKLIARLDMSRHGILKWVREGKFPKPLKPGGHYGHAYWRIEDVEKWERGSLRMVDIPKATHEGVLEIGNQKIRVARLDNGESVIHADDIMKIFEADFTPAQAEQFIKDLKDVTPHD